MRMVTAFLLCSVTKVLARTKRNPHSLLESQPLAQAHWTHQMIEQEGWWTRGVQSRPRCVLPRHRCSESRNSKAENWQPDPGEHQVTLKAARTFISHVNHSPVYFCFHCPLKTLKTIMSPKKPFQSLVLRVSEPWVCKESW